MQHLLRTAIYIYGDIMYMDSWENGSDTNGVTPTKVMGKCKRSISWILSQCSGDGRRRLISLGTEYAYGELAERCRRMLLIVIPQRKSQ